MLAQRRILLCLLLSASSFAFRSITSITKQQERRRGLIFVSSRKDDQLPEISPGEIDWDAEWQRTLRAREENNDVARPKEIELELERATKRAVRSTQSVVDKARQIKPSLPSVKGWNKQSPIFYLGCLAAISFLPAIFLALSTSSNDISTSTSYLV